MKKTYFRAVRWCINILARTLSSVRLPYTRKKLSYDVVVRMLAVLKVGDVIVTRTLGEASSVAIPKYWKHSAMYVGEGRIFHAVVPKAKFDYLANLILRTDFAAIVRFGDDALGQRAVQHISDYEGVPYDTKMVLRKDRTVFCSEAIFHALNKAAKAMLSIDEFLKPKRVLGYPTFTPNDLFESEEGEVVFKS